jgi:hypothetical protein
MVDLPATYLRRAAACEKRALDASEPAIQAEWDELAIQWHLMAAAATRLGGLAH